MRPLQSPHWSVNGRWSTSAAWDSSSHWTRTQSPRHHHTPPTTPPHTTRHHHYFNAITTCTQRGLSLCSAAVCAVCAFVRVCVCECSVLPVLGVVSDAEPFVSSLPSVGTFNGRVVCCLLVLHDSLVRCGGYDARVRVMLRRMTRLLGVRWEWWVGQEARYARALKRAVDQRLGEGGAAESSSSRALRYLKIGSAVVIGGVAIGLTGGLLAAPLLGAGLAGIGLTSAGATVTALVASTSGVVLVSSLFGIGRPTPLTPHVHTAHPHQHPHPNPHHAHRPPLTSASAHHYASCTNPRAPLTRAVRVCGGRCGCCSRWVVDWL